MAADAEGLRTRVLRNGWTRERVYAVVGVVLLVAPLVLPSFQTYVLTEVLVLALFATGFNLLYGYTGLLSFGHAMFYAGSGYVLANVVVRVVPALGLSGVFGSATPLVAYVVGAVLGVVFVTLLALPVGYLSVRLEEIYFAMITLSFSMAFYTLALKDVWGLTNGSDGLTVILGSAELLGFGISLADRVTFYYVVLAVVVPGMYALRRLVASPFGLVCEAVRENSGRAAAVGVDVRRQRWASFVLSAAFTGLAGVLIVPLHWVVAPGLAHWTTSAEPVIITVLGGSRAFLGPALGAVAFRYLRWIITQFPLLEVHWQLVFGVLVLAVLLFFERGVAGGVSAASSWLSELGERYRDDGTDGALAHVRSSLAGYRRRAFGRHPEEGSP